MFNRYMYVCLCLLVAHSLLALEWKSAPASVPLGESVPLIPYGKKPDTAQLVLKEHEHPASVSLWQTIDGLHISVVVSDEAFEPRADKKWLWKGDCLYLEIDGLGDNPTSYAMAADDAQLFFALSADGAVGKISDHGYPHLRGPMAASDFRIGYDAEKKLFTYEIMVAWKYLNSGPGISQQCAVAINVAHKGAKRTDNILGKRSNKRAKTRGLVSLKLEAPQQALSFVGGFLDQPLLSKKGFVEIPVALSAIQGRRISVNMGEQDLLLVTKQDQAWHGWIRVGHKDLRLSNLLTIRIDDQSHERRLSSLQDNHRQIIKRLHLSDDGDALTALHVNSIEALASDCMTRMAILDHNDPQADYSAWLTKVFQWQQNILKDLPITGFNLQQHLQRGRPLALAFVSESDGSLQFASLQLPHDFDVDHEYPLVCYLHGYGPKKPVDYLHSLVDNSGQDTLWLEGADPKVLNSGQRQCILVSPYGRGSIGYRQQAEKDVWQALGIAHKYFKVDENRRYMTGFSMGCDGAFMLASRRPGYWAAVNLSAGFYDGSSAMNSLYYANLKELPIIVWCGDQDKRMYNGLNKVLPIWKEHGIIPVHQTIAPGLPHTYPYYSYSEMLKKCYAYTRPAIESFSYRLPQNDGSSWWPLACRGFQALPQSGTAWEDVYFSVSHENNVFTITQALGILGFNLNPHEFGQFARSCDPSQDVTFRFENRVLYRGPLEKLKRILLAQAKP